MKKLSGLMLAIVLLMFAGTAMTQSLADAAKKARQQKKPTARQSLYRRRSAIGTGIEDG